MPTDRIIVISSLFPRAGAPLAGLFIRERMLRVAKELPLLFVSPRPWSPLDWLIRHWRPAFRPTATPFEVVEGVEVHRPRYFSLPGIGKRFDGWQMSRSVERCLRQMAETTRPVLMDAHFLYPDGYAAALIAQSRGLPLVVTIRGSKDERLIGTSREFGLRRAIARASRVVVVSTQLKRDVAIPMGADEARVVEIGNGVNQQVFYPENRQLVRQQLSLEDDAPVLITVGNLIGLKGFHRVIGLLPGLIEKWPRLQYLIVGGRSGHDDMEAALRRMVSDLGLEAHVRFCGSQPPEKLRHYYSAADLFVLATEYEGWANVLLEAMACGVPVVTTDVGGNAQVVSDPNVGTLSPFWDKNAFAEAIDEGLQRQWDKQLLLAHAGRNSWDAKIPSLVEILGQLMPVNQSDKPCDGSA